MPRPLATLVTVAALTLAAPAIPQQDFIARMEAEHEGDSPSPSPAATAAPRAEAVTETVVYARLKGKEVSGHLARPAAADAAAGIVLIHEWWGLNDNIRSVAERFAGEGYLALAVDLYEGESAEDSENAARLARAARDRGERLEENLRQAIAYLRQQGVSRVGVVGWCFGGGWSLRTALVAPDQVDAAVIYYGRIPTEAAELETLEAPVLGLFGALDGGIPPDDVRAFEAALQSLGKRASIHIYDGADHAFANPSGSRYQPQAAEDAWAKTLAFFAAELER